jgi:hypothetical protein
MQRQAARRLSPVCPRPATAAKAEALAGVIAAGIIAMCRDVGKLDVSAPFAACVLADWEMFVGQAAWVLAWCSPRSGGFAAEDVAAGHAIPSQGRLWSRAWKQRLLSAVHRPCRDRRGHERVIPRSVVLEPVVRSLKRDCHVYLKHRPAK